MTEQLHPMVPPNILLNNWESDWLNERENVDVLLIQAYQAGADAELEATLAKVSFLNSQALADLVRARRRPKPPSLKEQAQAELKRLIALIPTEGAIAMAEPIRRALEQLPDNE
jgi:hypothetical protein